MSQSDKDKNSTDHVSKQLTQLKQEYSEMIQAFDDEATDINRKLQKYKYILTHYKNNTVYTHETIREYLLNTFIQNSCKELMIRRHHYYTKDWNMADAINTCCQLMVQIAVEILKTSNNEHQVSIASLILFYCMNGKESRFYSIFGHDWRERRGQELNQNEVDDLKEWRINKIYVGARVDYLLSNRWRYGEIKEITDKQWNSGNIEKYKALNIMSIMNGMYPDNDKYFDEFALSTQTIQQIAKPFTKSTEALCHMMQWRKDLGTDDNNKCYLLNPNNTWYEATIIEQDNGANRIKVKYDDNDDNDSKSVQDHEDEWIFRDDTRLKPYDWNITNHSNDLNVSMEDDDDPNEKDIFAVFRGRITKQSFHLVDVVNEFGKTGGFDIVLERLSSGLSLQHLARIIATLAKCYNMYTKTFANEFIPKLQELIISILENLTEKQLQDFDEDVCDYLIKSVAALMIRYYSSKQIVQQIEGLILKTALQRLRSMSLKRRIDGALEIKNFCLDRKSDFEHGMSTDDIMNWMEKNNILFDLFGATNVILNKSGILIDGYVRQNFDRYEYLSMDVSHLIKLWYDDYSNTEIMKQTQDIIIKFICTEFELNCNYIEIIWNTMISVAMNEHNHDKEQQMYILSSIVNESLLHSNIFLKCIDNLKEHEYIVSTLKVITSILDRLETEKRYMMIGHLIDNKQLLQYYVYDMEYFRNYVKHYIDTEHIKQESEINNMRLFMEGNTYLEEIKERMMFLEFIKNNYTHLKLTESEQEIVYSNFLQNTFTKKEQELSMPILSTIMQNTESSAYNSCRCVIY